MIKSKKQMFIVLGVFTLVLMLGTVTYAFFNYTRTGSSNVIKVGRIVFNSTQGEFINLTNMFPIDVTNGIPNDNTKVGSVTINVTGDTTYEEGVEYLVSAVNVTNTVNNKALPISIDVSYTNSENKVIGTADNDYFTNRGGNSSIYKVLAKDTINTNDQLVVGYIVPGATGIDGNIVVRAYLDKAKIAITDTNPEETTDTNNDGYLDGTTDTWVGDRVVFTTAEWNSLQTNGVSFQVKVEANEGIWVEEPLELYSIIKRNVNAETLIDFANNSSSTNGQGIYILPGTENDTNPIYYYRGNIDNNNIVFGGFCWKAVRTTDTGGIKMIYYGVPTINSSGDNTTYNCTNDRPEHFGDVKFPTALTSYSGYYYADDYEIVDSTEFSVTYRLKSKNNPITQVKITSTSPNNDENVLSIIENYPYTCMKETASGTCTTLIKVVNLNSSNSQRPYTYSTTSAYDIGSGMFQENSNSMSDVGYMNNTRYTPLVINTSSYAIYGKDVIWDGTKYLVYEDNNTQGSTNTTKDSYHHYSCGTATNDVGDTECSSVRYYFYNNYYITLTNGEKVEDAIYKMTGNGSAETKQKNSGYVLNVNDSAIKKSLEDWFEKYLTNNLDASNADYQKYLEDTVFCNDRSFKTEEGTNTTTFDKSGWNPNGGSLSSLVPFSVNSRIGNGWFSTTNVPRMTCPNETDRFSVSSSIAHLKYPVGLLTSDEAILAGLAGRGGLGAYNNSYYLYTKSYDILLTPYNYSTSAKIGLLYSDGSISASDTNVGYAIRPVISLKHTIEYEKSGDGTPTNPYVVKYN